MSLQILCYLSALIFVILSVIKAVKYATMPIHLRWELYPVAHEVGHESGGSYLEDLEWWTKPQRKSFYGEIKYMLREALLFERCFHNNRGLWYFTYPFHMGLFFLIAWLILLFIGAIAMPSGTHVAESTNAWRWVIWYLTLVVGIAGLLLSTFGCLGLFIKRAADKSLSLYTVSADYFNLSFILAILLSGLLSWCLFDPTFTAARGFVRSLITCSPIGNMNALMIISVVLFSLFLIYMPFTHMTHAFTKYFTYHRVCWADEPNLRGTEVAKKVREVLEQPVSWSAPHVQPGKKWREIVSEGTETK